MMSRLRNRLTYANVTASLALFLAMGGTGYALTLPKNSVGPKQLKRNAVTSKKVKDGALLGKDFRAGRLPRGPQGPTGPQGPAGLQGAAGEPGSAAGYASVNSTGSVFEFNSKNVSDANVTKGATGTYCFQDLPFTPRSIMAASTGFFTGDHDVVVNVSSGYSGPDCPDSFVKKTLRVVTYDVSEGGFRDRSFNVWLED